MNKYIVLILIAFLFQNSMAQTIECNTHFEAKDTVYLPHYGQNHVLDSLLMITRSSLNTRANSGSNILFHIPIKIWLYHDDEGFGYNDALSEAEVYLLIDAVNESFAQNNTGIRFYLKCEIEHVFSTRFNFLQNEKEFDTMLMTHYDPRALNWHLVTWMYNQGGRATFPWNPQPHFSFAVAFYGTLHESRINTTIHEIGHALGLLHTHENTRSTGNYNGDASKCFQESVSRTRTQGIGCLYTAGRKKCEINGDALCDTEAAPNTENTQDIVTDIDCNYTGGGTDHWGDKWNPPISNIMSYVSNWECRTVFTEGQIAVMHSNIILHMNDPRCPYLGSIWCQPWYNTHSLSLSETVSAGKERYYTLSESIQAGGSSSYTIDSGGSVVFKAGKTVKLKPGFQAKPGSYFSAQTGAITNCDEVFTNYPALYTEKEYKLQTLNQEAYNKANILLHNALDRNIKKPQTIANKKENPVISENSKIIIYPNPTSTYISIETRNFTKEETTYRLYNTQGIQLSEIRSGKSLIQIPVSHLPEGIYVLQITGQDISTNRKIVLKK